VVPGIITLLEKEKRMTVRKRKDTVDTRWQASWKKSDGKRGFKDFPTKAEAMVFESKMKSDVIRGDYANPVSGKTKVETVYLDLHKTFGNRKPKTRDSYESLWKNMVEPVWGSRSISTITRSDFKNWVNSGKSLTGNQVSASRIRQSAVLLNLILEHAVDMNLLSRNPLGKTKGMLPKISLKKERRALEINDLLKLADYCGEYRLMILVAGFLGLRWAELIALTPEDFDFREKVIHVNKSLTEAKGGLTSVSTKSGGSRDLPIPAFLTNELRELVISTPVGISVFRSSRGENLRKSNFARRVFQPAVKLAGLSNITFHELRHTAISQQISGGADVVSVSKIAGHSSPEITLRVYSHELDKSKDLIRGTIEKNYAESACDRSATDQDSRTA
jgi:integrase